MIRQDRGFKRKSSIYPSDDQQDVDTATPEIYGDEPRKLAPEPATYSQRRGETLNKVFKAADKIIDKVASSDPYFPKELADHYKKEVRANPENAAKSLEKFYKATEGLTLSRRNPSFPSTIYDNDFSSLENEVRGLRAMKRGPEEKALSGQLADVDTQKNLNQLNSLRSQLDAVNKDIASKNLPEAVSERGAIENNNVMAGLNQKAAALSEHIKQLEAMTAGNQQVQPTQPQAAGQPADQDPNGLQHALSVEQVGAGYGSSASFASESPIMDYFKGLGIKPEHMTERLHKAMSLIVPRENWDDDVDPRSGVMRVLSALDPSGNFAQRVADQFAAARQEDQTSKDTQKDNKTLEQQDPRMRDLEARIESREERMRNLYASLRESPFMHTWPGIILYVLVGVITQNPAFAAKLIGGKDEADRRMIGNEIKGIQFEINRMDKQLYHYHQDEQLAKKEAIRRLQHKEDEASQQKWELSKMMINHNLIIQRNAARGNPDTAALKKLSQEFTRQMGLASKFQGTMQNEFADPKDRAEAKRNFDFYMRRAAQLDEDIRKYGGAVPTAEPAQEE